MVAHPDAAAPAERGRLAVQYRPTSALRPNPANARVHSDEQVEQIARSMDRFGVYSPILISADGMIRAGEGRWRAAVKRGHRDIPVIVLPPMKPEEYAALALADNRIAENSAWDEELLRQALASIQQANDPLDGLGFTDKEVERLFAYDDDDGGVVSIPVTEVSDRFWISVRGPLKDQAEVLAGLRKVALGLDGIDVELERSGSKNDLWGGAAKRC